MAQDPSPHPVDRHVGARIRLLRKVAGLSQTGLGERIDLTFQQIQKYERGFNRVSASKLYEIALVLGVPIGAFFEGLPTTVSGPTGGSGAKRIRTVNRLLDTPEGETIAVNFPEITSRGVRRSLAEVVRKLVEISNDRHSPKSAARDQLSQK